MHIYSSTLFCIVIDKSTVRVNPDSLEAIDIDIEQLDQLVTIENGTVLDWNVVDMQHNKINQLMIGKQYQIEFKVKTLLGSETVNLPITFADYTPPIVNNKQQVYEVTYDQVPNWEELVEVSDNYDTKLIININEESYDANLVEKVQLIKGSVSDSSGNSSAININVKVLPPQCASDAYFDGTNCVCNKGYQGDGWVACILKAPIKTQSKQQVNKRLLH